jgi:hypothetical protein
MVAIAAGSTVSTESSFNKIAPAMTYAVKGCQEIAAVMRVGFGVIALMQCFMRSLWARFVVLV